MWVTRTVFEPFRSIRCPGARPQPSPHPPETITTDRLAPRARDRSTQSVVSLGYLLDVTEESALFPSPETPPTSAPALHPQDGGRPDAALEEVVAWFRRVPTLENVFGSVFRQSLDEVLDGERTGRFDIRDASVGKTERTYLGTKVEIVTRSMFELPRGARMDYTVAGHDVDAKFSMTGVWQIPHEAMGHLCLLMTADDAAGTFDVGVVRITPDVLNRGNNRDGKKTISRAGRAGIHWLVRRGRLPKNLLLDLADADRAAIMSLPSGQRRINELLRRIQGRTITRTVSVTVARQRDGMKRCRDARRPLAADGIIVLGHQNDSPGVARALGLPVPNKGEFVSVRIVPAPADDDRPTAAIADQRYVVARLDEPHHPAPPIRY